MMPIDGGRLLILILAATGVFLIIRFGRILSLIKKSLHMQKNHTSFSRKLGGEAPSILVAGDSTAYGTGTDKPEESIAGRLAQEFPLASVENLSENGLKTGELLKRLKGLPDKSYCLIVLQIGGNDILRLTSLSQLNECIQELLREAKRRTPAVVLITSGDVGKAPFFFWPLGLYWSRRTRKVNELFRSAASKHRVHYVDLLANGVAEEMARDIPRFYSQDLLHPSGEGYGLWYEHLRPHLPDIPPAEDLYVPV